MKSRETLIRLKKFQVDEKRRRVAQIEGMIADFQRMSVDLEREIQTEQERAGINDPVAFRLSDLCQGRDPAAGKPDPLRRRTADPARRRQEPAGRGVRGTQESRAAGRARSGARARRGKRPRTGRSRQHRPDARPHRGHCLTASSASSVTAIKPGPRGPGFSLRSPDVHRAGIADLVDRFGARYDTTAPGMPLRCGQRRWGIAILGTLNADAS